MFRLIENQRVPASGMKVNALQATFIKHCSWQAEADGGWVGILGRLSPI